jgi:alpha-1,2-mannosyltransferase
MRAYLWAVPVVAAIGVFFAAQAMLGEIPTAHIDLEVYRFGVQAWWDGQNVYGPLPHVRGGELLPFIYPPFALLALSPLAILPWDASVALLYGANFLAIAATLYVTARRLWSSGGRRGAIVIGSAAMPIAFLLEPVSQTFEFGQVSVVLMGLVAVDCLAKRPFWPRGLGVGLAAAIKIVPGVFILYFLVRKDWRAAIVTGVTWLACTGIGFVADFHGSMKYWFGGLAGAAGVSGTSFRTNQTTSAVITRFEMSPGLTKGVWLLVAVAMLVMVIIAMRRSEPALALMGNALFVLLAAPTSWSHYWVWVVPGLLVMAAYAVRRGYERKWLAVPVWVAAIGCTIWLFFYAPFHRLPQLPFNYVQAHWTVREQILASTYVVGGLILFLAYVLPRLRRPRVAGDEPDGPPEPPDEAGPADETAEQVGPPMETIKPERKPAEPASP